MSRLSLLVVALLVASAAAVESPRTYTRSEFAALVREVSPAATVSGGSNPTVQCPDNHALSITTPLFYKIDTVPNKWSAYGASGPWEDVTADLPVSRAAGRWHGQSPVQCNINIINRLARGTALIGASSSRGSVPSWCTDPTALAARQARSQSTITRCSFYTSCLEPLYNCGSDTNNPNSYPVNYGKKYCTRFLDSTYSKMRTQAGRDFIDSTLRCLQRVLIPKVRTVTNCADLTRFAFDSHPACYTQRATSICRLAQVFKDVSWGIPQRPLDMKDVALTVEGQDLISQRSGRQMFEVAKTCGSQVLNKVWDSIFIEEGETLVTRRQHPLHRFLEKSQRKAQ